MQNNNKLPFSLVTVCASWADHHGRPQISVFCALQILHYHWPSSDLWALKHVLSDIFLSLFCDPLQNVFLSTYNLHLQVHYFCTVLQLNSYCQ